jgi:cysteinyl-tRNA synthetase
VEFQQGLETHIPKQAVNALLELDRLIWKAQQDFENPELISQARELLRELIVALGIKQEASPRNRAECLAPLVEDLLNLRAWYRRDKQYSAADKIRDSLKRVDIVVEDTENGTEWRIK